MWGRRAWPTLHAAARNHHSCLRFSAIFIVDRRLPSKLGSKLVAMLKPLRRRECKTDAVDSVSDDRGGASCGVGSGVESCPPALLPSATAAFDVGVEAPPAGSPFAAGELSFMCRWPQVSKFHEMKREVRARAVGMGVAPWGVGSTGVANHSGVGRCTTHVWSRC